MMITEIRDRYRYSAILIKRMVITDFKLRYQSSVLGYVWSLLRPLALFLILYLVFDRFLNLGESIPHFQVYLLTGIVFWNYFSEVTFSGVAGIVGKGDLIRKVNFPKYVIIVSSSISGTINLALNFIVIGLFMILSGTETSLSFIFAPLLVMELFLFSLSVSFLLGALYVRFRDVSYIWEVFIQGAFYATPILYPLSMVPEKAAKILMLNPVAQIIQDFRYVTVTKKSTTISDLYGTGYARIIPILIVVLVSVIAVVYFKNNSKDFAENV